MDTNSILLMVQDKLPKDIQSQQLLREKLDNLTDAQRDELALKLPSLNLTSPALVFWVGSFLFGNFGVGRFMIGDMLLGGIRLGIWIILTLFATFVLDDAEFGVKLIALLLALVAWIWWIVDLFLTGKKLRKKNLNKILYAI
ncbi:hypothetical protein [Helicobacter sp. T3_23-1056]